MSSDGTDRWIRLDGVVNLRDAGGLPVAGGARIRPRVLLRSDNLQDLTPSDVERLTGELGLRRVVDLRTEIERSSEGETPLQRHGVDHRLLTLIPDHRWDRSVDAAALPPQQREAREADEHLLRDRTATWADTDSPAVGFYMGYLHDHPENVLAAVRAVAEPDGTTLVHCAAGKDRTGVVLALALSAVGVPREEVVADYVASAAVIKQIIARLMATGTYAKDLQVDPQAHAPRAVTMEKFLDEVDREHGGPVGWLRQAGLAEDELVALTQRLVEG